MAGSSTAAPHSIRNSRDRFLPSATESFNLIPNSPPPAPRTPRRGAVFFTEKPEASRKNRQNKKARSQNEFILTPGSWLLAPLPDHFQYFPTFFFINASPLPARYSSFGYMFRQIQVAPAT